MDVRWVAMAIVRLFIMRIVDCAEWKGFGVVRVIVLDLVEDIAVRVS